MKGNKTRTTCTLIMISLGLVLVGLVLSVISSNLAYALTHLNILICACAGAAVLYALAVTLGQKGPEALQDALLLGAVALTAWAMCIMIDGRSTLAGYVYFSDLESNNPVAVQAMNLGIAAIAAYLAAIGMTIVAGFKRSEKQRAKK